MNLLGLVAIPFWVLLAGTEPTAIPPTLTLRDGRVFQLKEPPRTEGSRIVFTTTEGKTYTLPANEVSSFVAVPPTPTRPPRTYNPQDSHALGAIARQERAKTGKTTDLSAPTQRTPHPTKVAGKKKTGASTGKTPGAATGKTPAARAKTHRPTRTPTTAAPPATPTASR